MFVWLPFNHQITRRVGKRDGTLPAQDQSGAFVSAATRHSHASRSQHLQVCILCAQMFMRYNPGSKGGNGCNTRRLESGGKVILLAAQVENNITKKTKNKATEGEWR